MHKRGARRGRVSVFYGCSCGRKHHRIYEHWNLLKKNECRRVNAEKWKLHRVARLMLSRKSVTLSLSFKTSSYLQASILLSGFFARQKFRQFCSSCRVMNMGKKSELSSFSSASEIFAWRKRGGGQDCCFWAMQSEDLTFSVIRRRSTANIEPEPFLDISYDQCCHNAA